MGSNINKKGSFIATAFSESFINPYDTNFYVEPDGSTWIRLVHHNNPANARFASTNSFSTKVYLDTNRWFYASILSKITNGTYELMIKQNQTSGGTAVKYRWIQTVSPLTAVFEDVDAADVTKITTSGYSTHSSYGGIYILNSNTYFVANNSTKGNWFGALGAWGTWNNGIPGYGGVAITSGYIDLYLRVDNQINNRASIFNNSAIAHQLLEF